MGKTSIGFVGLGNMGGRIARRLVAAGHSVVGSDITAGRREAAPLRRRVPARFTFDLRAPLTGTMIFLRRGNEHGDVTLLARSFRIAAHWLHRPVRCEVDFTHQCIRFHALRRREPAEQPLLCQISYPRPHKLFKGPQCVFSQR